MQGTTTGISSLPLELHAEILELSGVGVPIFERFQRSEVCREWANIVDTIPGFLDLYATDTLVVVSICLDSSEPIPALKERLDQERRRIGRIKEESGNAAIALRFRQLGSRQAVRELDEALFSQVHSLVALAAPRLFKIDLLPLHEVVCRRLCTIMTGVRAPFLSSIKVAAPFYMPTSHHIGLNLLNCLHLRKLRLEKISLDDGGDQIPWGRLKQFGADEHTMTFRQLWGSLGLCSRLERLKIGPSSDIRWELGGLSESVPLLPHLAKLHIVLKTDSERISAANFALTFSKILLPSLVDLAIDGRFGSYESGVLNSSFEALGLSFKRQPFLLKCLSITYCQLDFDNFSAFLCLVSSIEYLHLFKTGVMCNHFLDFLADPRNLPRLQYLSVSDKPEITEDAFFRFLSGRICGPSCIRCIGSEGCGMLRSVSLQIKWQTVPLDIRLVEGVAKWMERGCTIDVRGSWPGDE